MVEDPVVLRVTDASVTYRVYESPPRLPDAISRRRLQQRRRRDIVALQGINVEIRRGESVGVIGPNGAGKSTLLRVLAGLQPVTSGTVEVAGEARLLGIQAAMKPSWTGRQSIEVGLVALGLSRREARARTTSVAAFAGLTEQLDLPVSTYSSGMRARLYFAISTERAGGTLLIDEALTTGDESFRKASNERLHQHLDAAESLVLVSHSLATVKELCGRTLVVEFGKIAFDGSTIEAVNYLHDEQ